VATALQPQDELLLVRALELARGAEGLASPNPTVGCVLVGRTGEVLGEGAHHYADRDHAEIAAMKQAAALGRSVVGATAYVTLEPCSHQGRTGPCADALIAASIARVVVATVDPNPLVGGQGVHRLRDAGVEVLLAAGPLVERARRLNDAFACFIQQRRPFVTLKAALSVDGMLAPPAAARSVVAPHWITGSEARSDAQRLRHRSDAILTGIGTVLADDPSLTDRSGLSRRRPLLRVVLDSQLRTPLQSRLVSSAASDVLLICAETADAGCEAALLARGAEVLRVPSVAGRLDLAAVLQRLAERSVIGLLVEAGSAVNAAFLQAGLVDQLVLYYAESELGLSAAPFAAGYDSPYAVQQRLTQVTRAAFPSDVVRGAEDVRVTGYLRDPWSAVVNVVA
jgi:diaminohydroxyphosphoribosylaminopyrimidine deaminase/5-amino-6-(5-phosphoribosylamino)uracil reductase